MEPQAKVVLVSGASSGIGAACAQRFAMEGFHVWMLARDEAKLRAAAEAIRAKLPKGTRAQIRTFPVDLCEQPAMQSFWKQIESEGVLPDFLINNAGAFLAAPVLKAKREEAERMISLNFLVPWEMLKAASALSMKQGRELVVLNVLSVTALKTYPGCGIYGATKAALLSLMASARAELRGKGIRITNLVPGAVDTPLWDGFDLSTELMMDPEEVASVIFHACEVHPRTLVEEIVLRPRLGDF
jgi:short-subunit dehydrogenase